jgi:RNA polymerase sigma-70 factor
MTGEPGGLARKLLEHRDGLFGYILALVRNWQTAEELFQEVSLVVLQKGQEGVTVLDFGPWSREIARRTVLNHWKTAGRTPVLSGEAVTALDRAFSQKEAEGETGGQEQLRKLRHCMKALPDHMRQIVDLRYNDSLSIQEIARRTGRSAGAVQVALSRVRMRLLECTKKPGVSPA